MARDVIADSAPMIRPKYQMTTDARGMSHTIWPQRETETDRRRRRPQEPNRNQPNANLERADCQQPNEQS